LQERQYTHSDGGERNGGGRRKDDGKGLHGLDPQLSENQPYDDRRCESVIAAGRSGTMLNHHAPKLLKFE
jgi:hypothetical protein